VELLWGILIIILAVVLAKAMGKTPSAVHDPEGYKNHQGCNSLLALLALIGIALFFARGCFRGV